MDLRHPPELGIEVLLELCHVEALELDLRRYAQQARLLEDPARDVPRGGTRAGGTSGSRSSARRMTRGMLLIPGRVPAGEDADEEDSEDPEKPCTSPPDGIVHPQGALDEPADPDHNHPAKVERR